jgi:glutathione synthase/RimK-type ligase-like ATP-grasp enzyme
MKSVLWIWPDRSSSRGLVRGENYYWKGYREAAAAVGMHMDVISPEDIEIIYHVGTEPKILVNGQQMQPENTMFVTMLYTFPSQVQDAWLQTATFWTLKQAGFYLPIPPEIAITMNEKLATLLFVRSLGLRALPTIRLVAGRDIEERHLETLLEGFSFPLLIKPNSWGSGMGVMQVKSWTELRAALRLASAADLTMLLQPCLPISSIIDYRVYCIDGAPRISLARTPGAGEIVANVAQGGDSQVVEVPPAVLEPATQLARMLPLPYCCIDFLFDGQNYWFSEIEPDGALSASTLRHEPLRELLKERFRAYDRAHERWLNQRTVS